MYFIDVCTALYYYCCCCADINECLEETDECQYHDACANIAGTYNCDCPIADDKLGLDGLNCISQ